MSITTTTLAVIYDFITWTVSTFTSGEWEWFHTRGWAAEELQEDSVLKTGEKHGQDKVSNNQKYFQVLYMY